MSDTTDTSASNATLGLEDIKNALTVIDHACDQGAFKGWTTMVQCLTIRNKLAAFVEAADAINAANASTEAPAKEPETVGN